MNFVKTFEKYSEQENLISIIKSDKIYFYYIENYSKIKLSEGYDYETVTDDVTIEWNVDISSHKDMIELEINILKISDIIINIKEYDEDAIVINHQTITINPSDFNIRCNVTIDRQILIQEIEIDFKKMEITLE